MNHEVFIVKRIDFSDRFRSDPLSPQDADTSRSPGPATSQPTVWPSKSPATLCDGRLQHGHEAREAYGRAFGTSEARATPAVLWEGAAKLRELMDSAAKFGTDLFDYESWAPRSARAWRLGEVPTEAQTKQEPDEVDLLVANLQRLSRDDYETEFEESFADEGSLTGAQLLDMLRYKVRRGLRYEL